MRFSPAGFGDAGGTGFGFSFLCGRELPYPDGPDPLHPVFHSGEGAAGKNLGFVARHEMASPRHDRSRPFGLYPGSGKHWVHSMLFAPHFPHAQGSRKIFLGKINLDLSHGLSLFLFDFLRFSEGDVAEGDILVLAKGEPWIFLPI